MPELPDIVAYLDALRPRVVGRVLTRAGIISPFVVRSVDPPIFDAEGRAVCEVSRLGKRIVLSLAGDLHIVMHLMIAGRLRWAAPGARPPGKITLAAFDFAVASQETGPKQHSRSPDRAAAASDDPAHPDSGGTLFLTEAATKKRAALHLVHGRESLAAHNPGGLEVLEADLAAFRSAVRRENHTLKRALTDPRTFSGIGNAYSDEILHAAGLSPLLLTQRITDEQITRLFEATRRTLNHWIAELRREFGGRFPGPGEITAFRPGFSVHGRYGQACPACGGKVQRIRYAENETNYCPRCQTGGRVLADRSLSRLLKDDWPKTAEDL